MGVSNHNVRPDDTGETVNLWIPHDEAQRDTVREQLGRILSSGLFANSKRYPSFLRYIVEETLAGRASSLKERTLGIEVFGRDTSYDTNADPVVRISAAQVRRRLAEYYGVPSHQREMRIELVSGSYVPQFRRPTAEGAVVRGMAPRETPGRTSPDDALLLTAVTAPAQSRHRLRGAVLAGCLIVPLALVWLVMTVWVSPDPVKAFWGPVWDNSNALMICVPGNFPGPENPTQTAGVALPAREPGKPLTIEDSLGLNSITWPDATALYSVVGFLQRHGRPYRVSRERDLPFADLRTGSAVMVGGPLNNQWLKRLSTGYRFGYRLENGAIFVTDSQNPSHKRWGVNLLAPYSSFDVDYGIFSRAWDPVTEHWVLVASGMASYGTVAAADFLTNARQLAMLARQAPKGWERKNIQVVFATKVVNGNAGPPHILAVHVW